MKVLVMVFSGSIAGQACEVLCSGVVDPGERIVAFRGFGGEVAAVPVPDDGVEPVVARLVWGMRLTRVVTVEEPSPPADPFGATKWAEVVLERAVPIG